MILWIEMLSFLTSKVFYSKYVLKLVNGELCP